MWRRTLELIEHRECIDRFLAADILGIAQGAAPRFTIIADAAIGAQSTGRSAEPSRIAEADPPGHMDE